MTPSRRILIAFTAITFTCTAHASAAAPDAHRTTTEHPGEHERNVETPSSTASTAPTAPATTDTAVEEPDRPGRPGTPVFIGVVVVMLVWGGLFAWRAQRRP